MALNMVLIYGSMRRSRQGIRAARFIERELKERTCTVSLVDACEVDLPLLDRMYKEYPKGEAPAALEELATLFRSADGFVIVSGEYNHGPPAALTNLLDHFLEEYFFRPSGIASYSAGSFGGVRAAMQLRATLAELGMPSIPSLFPIPQVQNQFDEDGVPADPDGWKKRFKKFGDELYWYAEALKTQRETNGTPY